MQTQVLVGLMMFPMSFWMLMCSTIVEEEPLVAIKKPVVDATAFRGIPEGPPPDDSKYNTINPSTLQFDSMEHSTLEHQPSSGILSVIKSKVGVNVEKAINGTKKAFRKAKKTIGNKMVKGRAMGDKAKTAIGKIKNPFKGMLGRQTTTTQPMTELKRFDTIYIIDPTEKPN